METMSFWGEGVEGVVDLEVKSISAIGCDINASESPVMPSAIKSKYHTISSNPFYLGVVTLMIVLVLIVATCFTCCYCCSRSSSSSRRRRQRMWNGGSVLITYKDDPTTTTEADRFDDEHDENDIELS
jgi:hypothetical protein